MFDWFEMNRSAANQFQKLCEIVAKLRAPGGCPWDREQTHESLLPALIEEAYEVAEAARAKDDAHFREELGDLLLLVVMHAEIARETGRFDIGKIIREASDKFVTRFNQLEDEVKARGKKLGDVDLSEMDEIWNAIKKNDEARMSNAESMTKPE